MKINTPNQTLEAMKITQMTLVATHGQDLTIPSFEAPQALGANPNRPNPHLRLGTKHGLVSLLLVTLGIGLLPVRADEIDQLKVTVNQLDHATVPALAQRQKEMNAILKQGDKYGKTRIRVTLVQGRQNADPKDGGSSIAPNGNVPDANAIRKLIKEAQANEIKHGGSKFWVGKEVKLAGDVINAGTVRGTAATVVREQSGHNGDARTWTHELGHQLGLLGDGHTTDSTNSNNLMFGAREIVNGTNRVLAGTDLTTNQFTNMLANLSKLNPTKAHTKEQQHQPISHEAVRTIVHSPTTSLPTLDGTQIVIEEAATTTTNPAVRLRFNLNLLLETNVAPARFQFFLDLDNDPSTGDPNGFDAMADYLFEGKYGQAELQFFPSGEQIPLPNPDLEISALLGTGETNSTIGPTQTVISSDLPLELLTPMAPQIRVLLASQIGTEQDLLGPETISTLPDPEPELSVTPIEGLPGSGVALQASGFTPNTPYHVLCGDEPVADGTTLTNGDVNATFAIPALEPGDYLVDVIDDAGQVQDVVLRVHDPIGLQAQFVNAKTLSISFKTILNVTYVVEATTSLENPDWQPLQTVAGTGDPVQLTFRGPDMAYFRYRIPSP